MTHDPDPLFDPLADPSPDTAATDDVARPEQPPMDDDAGLVEDEGLADDEAETLGDFA